MVVCNDFFETIPSFFLNIYHIFFLNHEERQVYRMISELLHEKTNNLGFRPGPTKLGLYRLRIRLEV